MRKIPTVRLAAHPVLVDMQDELVISTYVDEEAFRSFGKVQLFAEMQDGAFRRAGSGDPLGGPRITWVRSLRSRDQQHENCHYSAN